jgi:arsenate reductase
MRGIVDPPGATKPCRSFPAHDHFPPIVAGKDCGKVKADKIFGWYPPVFARTCGTNRRCFDRPASEYLRVIVFGLATCDTTRSALRQLREAGVDATFRDVRQDPLGEAEVVRLAAALGDPLANRNSATWRGLSETDRSLSLPSLVLRHPTVMKRPVIDTGAEIHLGWGKDVQGRLLP